MAGPYQWDVNDPPGSQSRRQGDDHIRSIKAEWLRAANDGPMANFPTDAKCTLGWGRIYVFGTLAELQAIPLDPPHGRLGVVTTDAFPLNNGLYLEKATGWSRIQG